MLCIFVMWFILWGVNIEVLGIYGGWVIFWVLCRFVGVMGIFLGGGKFFGFMGKFCGRVSMFFCIFGKVEMKFE